MMRQRIEKGIGRAVISLRRIAEDARDGREHDKAIELHVPRPFVQQPGAMRLRCHHGPHALAGERGERRVVDHHREVEDAAQRLIRSMRISANNRLTSFRRTDVRPHDAHLDAAFAASSATNASGLRS